MRAVLCRDFAGPDHLEMGEAPDPVPADDEILIEVHAASVRYMDYLMVSGGYQMRPPTPFVPGTEAAGIVVDAGGHVTRFRPGDRVACLGWIGGLGERLVAKECTDKVRDRLKALTAGKGVDVCFDNVGGPIFDDLARSMGWGGRLLPIGFASGDIPRLPMNLPLLKNFSVVGVFTGAWEDKEPEAARLAKETLMRWIADGSIRPHVGMVVPTERIRKAMAAIGSRTSSGRVVVKIR